MVSSLFSRFKRPPKTWASNAKSPWGQPASPDAVQCPICQWSGESYQGEQHSERAMCPQCGSIARDRMLFWTFIARTPKKRYRVLETSPRLGHDYRSAMGQWFSYVSSDYDQSSHVGVVRLDLQDIDLPDGSVDILLTPHVLEHVPDTSKALREIFRILSPGGRMYLQIPVLQGVTAPPTEPEFHGDNTPVFWRFGFDFTRVLVDHGFTTTLLCTDEWSDAVTAGWTEWPEPTSTEFDVSSMLAGAIAQDLTPFVDRAGAVRLGLLPAYQFLTWECIRP